MDLDNMHSRFAGRGAAVLAVTVAMAALSTTFVLLRIVSRGAIVKKLSMDDYFIVLAWLVALGLSISICYGCAFGLGRHEEDIPPAWQPALGRADYAFSVLYQPALMTTKTSILAFYLSLPTANRLFKWACIVTLVVVNAGGLALGLFTVFQCRPIGAAFEHPPPPTAHCTDIVTIYLSSAPLNIITDLALLFLPMPILTGMRLPRKQKIILVVTFSFGVFVAVVDVVRIAYLQSAAMTRFIEIQNMHSAGGTASRHAPDTDFSWYASLSFMWSVVEVNVGIMVACVPGLKPLASRFLPRMLRDIGDPSSRGFSVSSPPRRTAEMAEDQRVPSIVAPDRDVVHRRDFGPSAEADPVGMMEFLTTPDGMAADFPRAERTETALTNTSRHTKPASPTFFDFVNTKRRKSMVHLTNRESVFPIATVTILFFIWGFEYGLVDVLNQQFQRVSHMTPGQTTGIHSAYFAGYLVGPTLVGRPALRHWGFRACYTVGLAIYACGTLTFWPAAVLASFPAFLVTNFIVAFGLSILEVSANPFIALCGPPRHAEMRLNLSQGVQAVGSVIAPLIAERAFFRKALDAPSLVDTQWAYLGISLFTVLLAVVYYYVPLPEATDRELDEAAERPDGVNDARILGGRRVVWFTLALGVFAQFCYVGAQEVNATSFDLYLASVAPALDRSNYLAIAHTAFAVSRFASAGLGFWVKPRLQLAFLFPGAILFEALAMKSTGPAMGTASIVLAFFMEGPLFSLIFAQSLRGLGRHTKIASVLITSAISGGAVFAPISSHLAHSNRHPGGPMRSLAVAVAAFAGGTVFAAWLNLMPQARKQVDPVRDPTAGGPTFAGNVRSEGSGSEHSGGEKEEGSTSSRARVWLASSPFGSGGGGGGGGEGPVRGSRDSERVRWKDEEAVRRESP